MKKRKRKFCAEIFTTRSVKLVGGILYSRRRRKRNLYLIVVYRVGNTSRNIWTSWRDTRQFYIWILKRRKIETTAGFSFQITRQRRTQSVTRFTSLFSLSFSFLFSSFLFFFYSEYCQFFSCLRVARNFETEFYQRTRLHSSCAGRTADTALMKFHAFQTRP